MEGDFMPDNENTINFAGEFKSTRKKLSNLEAKKSGLFLGLTSCMILICVLLLCALSFGGIVMLILGSICVDNYNNNNEVDLWCPTKSDSIAILVIGCLLTFCCCIGCKYTSQTQQ